MLSRDCWFFVLVVLVSALPHTAAAQSSSPRSVSSGVVSRPFSSASRITESPSIDGALDERVWQEAAPLSGFVQAEPFEGSPASENTEVRILYDDEAIYVGVLLHDRKGGGQHDLKQVFAVETDFDGAAKSGEWILEVADTAAADVGTLAGWSLTIE